MIFSFLFRILITFTTTFIPGMVSGRLLYGLPNRTIWNRESIPVHQQIRLGSLEQNYNTQVQSFPLVISTFITLIMIFVLMIIPTTTLILTLRQSGIVEEPEFLQQSRLWEVK